MLSGREPLTVITFIHQMAPDTTIHQLFFPFDGRALEDYPLFACSQAAFRGMRGWDYRIWDEPSVEQLCQARFPGIWETYRQLPYTIQRLDIAKYMILHTYGLTVHAVVVL